MDDPNEEEPRVSFSPPLYLQRRIWVLDIIRRETITDLLDVGCGDGGLLSTLCNPAPWLSSPYDAYQKFKNLHPKHIRGLDISEPDLQLGIKFTTPPSHESYQSQWMRPKIRWEPLQVNIWKGGLQEINHQFINVECIVATEVIEHLPDEIITKFAPILLGVYHPRLLLVTTPSYTFNARFTPPPDLVVTEETRPGGHPDPTGRTTRVFRHPDHRFEWTVEEFTNWCTTTAVEWGYNVKIDGVGKPIEKDEWGRDDDLGFASQVAIFTRIEGEEAARARESKANAELELQSQCDHELLVTHHHPSHSSAQNPLQPFEILEKVQAEMEFFQDSKLTIRELWNQDTVAFACGGNLDNLVEAITGEGTKFILYKAEENWREEWMVELIGGVGKRLNLWSESSEESDQEDEEWEDESNLCLSQDDLSVGHLSDGGGWPTEQVETDMWGTSSLWIEGSASGWGGIQEINW